MVDIYEHTDADIVFQQAIATGFVRGQVSLWIHEIQPDRIREVALASQECGFHVDAVGCYLNPLRLDDHTSTGADISDWQTVVENMGMFNGVERIVSWSGTHSRAVATPNLLNQEPETFEAVVEAIEGLRERVRGIPVEIILEPFSAHVLHDARTCQKMVERFSTGDVLLVLDATNLILPTEYAVRDQRAQALVGELAKCVGLIHLKDIKREMDGTRTFTRPGSGDLAYGPYLKTIHEVVPEVPMVVTQVSGLAEMAASREFLQDLPKKYGF